MREIIFASVQFLLYTKFKALVVKKSNGDNLNLTPLKYIFLDFLYLYRIF